MAQHTDLHEDTAPEIDDIDVDERELIDADEDFDEDDDLAGLSSDLDYYSEDDDEGYGSLGGDYRFISQMLR